MRYLREADGGGARVPVPARFRDSGAACDMGYGFMEGFQFMQIALLLGNVTGDAMEVPDEYIAPASTNEIASLA